MKKGNTVARILKVIAFITWGIGLIATLIIWGSTPVTEDFNLPLIFGTALGALATGFSLFAFGEVVSLLQKIVNNTTKD